jgi:hypothetical protein
MTRSAIAALFAAACLGLAACESTKKTDGSAAISGEKACCAEGEKAGKACCAENKTQAEGECAKNCTEGKTQAAPAGECSGKSSCTEGKTEAAPADCSGKTSCSEGKTMAAPDEKSCCSQKQ